MKGRGRLMDVARVEIEQRAQEPPAPNDPAISAEVLSGFTKSRYSARWWPVESLSLATKVEMGRLYLSNYDATNASVFLHDLEAKDEALLIHAGDELVGFTTLRLYRRDWNDHPIRVLYSGDTIVQRRHWGQHALAFAWIAHAGQIRRECANVPLYWFLLVKGHRTFRYLPAFMRSFHPHWSRDFGLKSLADALALEMFPRDYNPATGLVEFEPSRGQLRPEIAQPEGNVLEREEVRFFLARNPGYVRGHELVCLSELEAENFRPLARRIFMKQRDANQSMGAAARD